MTRFDLTGQKFGRLTVLKFSHTDGHRFSSCLCDCGETKTVRNSGLLSGNTRSCGCLQLEIAAANIKKLKTTHGMTETVEYYTWGSMKDRCYNKKNKAFRYYGGRGIKVCKRWISSFENFFADMGLRPSPKHSIDRINNNENYSPKNCKWSTMTEQVSNRRVFATSRTGVRYVTPHGDKYVATPNINGKPKYIGTFKTIKQAQKAIEEYLCQKN